MVAKCVLRVTEMFNRDKNGLRSVASRPYFVSIAHFLYLGRKIRKCLHMTRKIEKLTFTSSNCACGIFHKQTLAYRRYLARYFRA